MKHSEAKLAIKQRLMVKKIEANRETALTDINNTLETAKFKDWVKDLAFRSCLENRTDQEWALYYNVSKFTLQKMKYRPEYTALKASIQYNLRAYTVHMKEELVRKAMNQYNDIFDARLTSFNIETKRKAARELVEMFGFGVVKPEDSKSQDTGAGSSSDLRAVSPVSPVSAETLEVDVSALKHELKQLEDLSGITAQVAKYTIEDDESLESNKADATDIRRTTKGFHNSKPNPITVD